MSVVAFWDKGHACGSISTSDSDCVAMACKMWLLDNLRLMEINSRFPEIELRSVEHLLNVEIDPGPPWQFQDDRDQPFRSHGMTPAGNGQVHPATPDRVTILPPGQAT